jgi:hypothetical protein
VNVNREGIVMTSLDQGLDETLQDIRKRLNIAYGNRYTTEDIERAVVDAAHSLDGARIRTFVPIFVERMARERLLA